MRNYPPFPKATPHLQGRLPTRSSPVRHATLRRARVRLACIRHAASVDPEPGSNSPPKCLLHRVAPDRRSAQVGPDDLGLCCGPAPRSPRVPSLGLLRLRLCVTTGIASASSPPCASPPRTPKESAPFQRSLRLPRPGVSHQLRILVKVPASAESSRSSFEKRAALILLRAARLVPVKPVWVP
jgi:hypothetical protein